MERLLDRFCKYVQVDTQADETSSNYPSSPGQRVLGEMLAAELTSMGAAGVHHDEFGLVWATIPSNVDKPVPVIAWVAHVDTSPEFSGRSVKPLVHRNYQGADIVLPGDRSKIIRPVECPALLALVGKTLVTSDGTTLLGSDDKSGVAVIMEATERLLSDSSMKHGPIRILFTCDEEIGRGVDHVDLHKLDAAVAYTLDGGGSGEIDVETFSADLAVVTFKGINIHPAMGKGKMVNAVRIASAFVDRLPKGELSPESTEGREGFVHPYRIEGGVPSAAVRILLRDFSEQGLRSKEHVVRVLADATVQDFPGATFEVTITQQYRNMASGLSKEPRAVEYAELAYRRLGIEPKRTIVRGGTDGSRLTELGLPTPNISTGEHNLHSPLEWTCLEEMETAVVHLLELSKVWAEKG